ncbi:LysR family transcriptional regulator [Oceanimonas pelagia]|uniref:LysR family transcriptional regulator n=1 Tax=Oceanimonas pelagia TaxID=3028314 RepID=A0AA50KMJ8_9GAMM|nr:LysR family transcriptional regulator [Oceanimonas pelagia]WMC09846.1 LysR family transcriptional regulator [Oceanimonas pelagia]
MRHLVEEMTTFAVVVQAGSITGAAKVLKRSKAYVSLQVSRLEDSIGLQLLYRTTRRIELTEAGRAYVDFCTQLLDITTEASKAVDVLKGEMSGIIRLSVPVSFGHVFLSEIISAFQAKYSSIQVQLELHNGIRDLKVEGLDMAIRISSQLDDDLVAIRIGELSTPIFGSPSYFAQYGRPGKIDDLVNHIAILHSRVDATGSWPFSVNSGLKRFHVPWRMSIDHYPLIREAALSGKGLARLPTYLVEKDVCEGRLDSVLNEFISPAQPIYLVYNYQGMLPLKNRRFIEFVKAWFSERATANG